ncbi:MAG: ATP-binding protein [Gudongella sp.]|nr:ATP-binding protein [Gudongella sp.]
MKFDLERFLRAVVAPGVNHNIVGPRGSGKTHFAVWLAQKLADGGYSDVPVEVITNVVFVKKTESGSTAMGHPRGVHYADTMSDMFRIIGQILAEYGRDVTILTLMDEAQNYMLSDANGDPTNVAMVKYMANTRKFNQVMCLMTPARNNLVPRIRNFADDEKIPGYCGVLWQKDRAAADQHIRRYGLNMTAKQLISMQMSAGDPPVMLPVGSSGWTTPISKLRAGGYAYDHRAVADWALGEGFNLKSFLQQVSKTPSDGLASAIEGFFSELGKEQGDDVMVHIRDQCHRVDRMRADGVTWAKIEMYEGEPSTTVQSRYRKFFQSYPSSRIKMSRYPDDDEVAPGRRVSLESINGTMEGENPSSGFHGAPTGNEGVCDS